MKDHILINSALNFAALAHANQKRKSTEVPYIVHPVGVMMVLVECGVTDPELLAAALLHDTLEDTGTTLDELSAIFGERVAEIIDGCSEPDKSETWEHRKEHTIAYLKLAPREIALVSAADKLHNVRSMLIDYETLAQGLWTRFKRGPVENAWYYRSVLQSLQAGALAGHVILDKLAADIDALFPQTD
jgi:(p)ppGpp synthase/HD superfamily hydrolase